MISWNINGVRAAYERGDLEWALTGDADVFCLQETKASFDQLPKELANPPGWQVSWESGEKKGYCGVATFVRAGIEAREVGRGFGVPRFDCEGRILVTDLGAFVLLNIYFPNGGRSEERLRYKMDFYAAFQVYVDELVAEGRDVVVCGDVNTAHREIDVALPERWSKVSGFLPEERAWLDQFLASGWVDTFRAEHGDRPHQYSWWDTRTDARPDNLGWRIDYFLINERLEDFLVDAWISPHIMGSDHCPVGLELEIELPRKG